MEATYEYMPNVTFMDSINIENIGECCLECYNDLGEGYYLWITTSLGMTKVLQYGPETDGITPAYCSYSFQQFQYNEVKIDKLINRFITDPKKVITQIQQVDPCDIMDKLTDLKEFMNGDQ